MTATTATLLHDKYSKIVALFELTFGLNNFQITKDTPTELHFHSPNLKEADQGHLWTINFELSIPDDPNREPGEEPYIHFQGIEEMLAQGCTTDYTTNTFDPIYSNSPTLLLFLRKQLESIGFDADFTEWRVPACM